MLKGFSVPVSKSRKNGKDHIEAKRREDQEFFAEEPAPEPLPTWYKAVMFGLMIVGLIWICLYYVSQTTLPVPGIGGWNIFIGFGIAIIGFLMTTRWR